VGGGSQDRDENEITQMGVQNPYADIVGSGPYGENQATYTAPPPFAPSEPRAMRQKKRVEFAPYFDPSDTRNDEDLRSKEKVNFDTCAVLGAKDKNAKLRQESREKIDDAVTEQNIGKETPTTKRDGFVKEKVLPALPSTKTPVKTESRPKTPTAPMKPRSIFKDVAIPRSLEAEGKRTGANSTESKRLSVIVEAPSPLKLSTKKQHTRPAVERTPTLDHIVKLRTEEQAKALAALEGKPPKAAQQARVPETQHKKKASSEEKRKGIEFIPDIDFADSVDWGKSLHELAGPPPPKSAQRNLAGTADAAGGDVNDASSVYSSDEDADGGEIEKLTNAVAGLRPFQDLPSLTPDRTSFRRKSAVPEGLDLGKLKAGKEESAGVAEREKTTDEAMAEVLEALEALEATEATEAAARGAGSLKESSSKESFVTASSDEYEQIGSATELETDQNGGKERWFTGFRQA
jgi:hypothetical protein